MNDRRKVSYPPDHEPFLQVPKGGSSCESCKYLKNAEKRICGEPNFIKWNGSDVIPLPIDEACSDWYRPSEPKSLGRAEARRLTFRQILDDMRPVAEEKE